MQENGHPAKGGHFTMRRLRVISLQSPAKEERKEEKDGAAQPPAKTF
jgi:hypothetical protein